MCITCNTRVRLVWPLPLKYVWGYELTLFDRGFAHLVQVVRMGSTYFQTYDFQKMRILIASFIWDTHPLYRYNIHIIAFRDWQQKGIIHQETVASTRQNRVLRKQHATCYFYSLVDIEKTTTGDLWSCYLIKLRIIQAYQLSHNPSSYIFFARQSV